MKLSDISTLALTPGTYTIVAAFDGDNRFNAVQAQYILTVNAVSSTSRRGRSVTDDNEDGQKPVIVKRDPDFYFSPSTVYFNESETGSYVFNFSQYIVNNDEVAYNISLSEGLYLETNGNVSWYDSGTYTITLTSSSTDVFNSKVITMTLNVVSKVNPQIEYRNDGTYILQDGVLVKKYYNIEKRDGVYKFDLMQPSNPYSLPLEYKIEGNANCYIDVENNKVYVSREGRYKITATFAGDNTYRPSITSYVLSYYENTENEDKDNQGTYIIKQSPNLSFSSNTISLPLSGNGTYTGQQVNNPYGVAGIWTTSNNANITADGTIITLKGTGNVIVYYTFYGDEYYNSQSVSYVLHVYVQENPDNKPIPNIYFPNNMVTVVENEAHDYYIQQVINPDAVNVNYYCNGQKIENGILHTEYIGNLTIIAQTEEDDTFYKTSTTYTLTINAYEQSRPQIWFLTDNETVNETADHTYLIQLANCNVDVPIIYTVSSGMLEDQILTYNGIGTVVITATTQETFYYESVRASYVLNILEVNKLSPGIYFKYPYYGKATVDNKNQSQSNTYDILELVNPHNVEVRFYTDRGTVDNETNATKLYMDEEENKTGIVNIYAQSIENDTYKSEIATYKLKISDTISLDLDYNGDISSYGYSTTLKINASGKLNTPTLIEIVRFPKDPNFIFSPDEWYMTKASSTYEVNNLIYSEDGDESVISANITFARFSTHYFKFYFKGNEKFNETPEINVNINYTNSQQSPEISFPSNIEVITQTGDYNYVLQNVENPHNVEIVYSSSKGTVSGNILHYEDVYNLIIYATSVETDEYYSQTIRYTLKINKAEKPSRGWHFAAGDDTPIPVHQNNKYVVRDIVDENGDLVPIEDLTGQFSCSVKATFEYDDEQGKYIVTLTNPYYMFDYNNGLDWFTINYKLPETGQYKAETISYRQYISDKPKANISFNEDVVNLKEVEEQRYRIQTLNNPDNHPIVWTCEGDGHFDDPNDPKYILLNRRGNSWTKIYAKVAETDSVKATTATYTLYTLAVTQHRPGWEWSLKWKDEYLSDPSNENSETGYVDPNNEGVYDLWNMLDLIGGWTWDNVDRIVVTSGSYKVSDKRYLILNTEVENPYNPGTGTRFIDFEIWSKEDFEHTSGVWRLSLVVKYPYMRYLFENNNTRIWYETEFIGEVNEEYELEFGRWPYDPDFVFNADEWSYTDQGWGTIKNLYTKEVNGYTVLCGTFSTSQLNKYNMGRINFSGNNIFYPCYIAYDIYVSKKQEPQDTRLIPKLSFNKYMVYEKQTLNDQYLLQTLNKPDDCEIDRWEAEGEYGIIPTIIDDTYVYYPIGDISEGAHRSVHLTVYTKESDIYKAYSIGYTLYVTRAQKQGSGIKFKYSTKTANKNDQHQYILPELLNPNNLPVTWSTTLGTIENGYLVYDGVGTATITVTFDGDDTYEATTTSCTYKINNQYNKQYLTYTKGHGVQMQVVFGEEYSFEILRWPVSIGLEFNVDDWRCSWVTLTSSFTGLYSVDEGEYRVLMGKYIPNKAGWGDISTEFKGNDHFYHQYHVADFEISWTRAAELVNPNISFSESTVTMPYSNTEKYLIQTPTGAAGVTFNEPTTSLGYIEKVNNDYYVVYDGTEGANITISISSVQDSTYYSQTISYTLNVEAKPIVVQDTQISFANSEVTLDYVWEQNKTKRYKVQDLYNPWGLNVIYTITAGNLRQESDGYYIYYDSVGDITINAVGQSNQYYNGSSASYTMHIVSIGEDFVMQFAQSTVTVTQTSEGRYLLQQVTLNPEVSDIRNNIIYSAAGATIEAAGDDFYIVYNGIGNLRVKALFESDNHYKSKEAYYTLVIEEMIQKTDPIISISSNRVEIEEIDEVTTFTAPQVTNTSGVEYKWYIDGNEVTVTNGSFTYNATGNFTLVLKTTETKYLNSINLYCDYINKDIEKTDPIISISSNRVEVEEIDEVTTFTAPQVTNTTGVEYKWYIDGNEVTVTNGSFTYNATGNFTLVLKTTETKYLNSINLYCDYVDKPIIITDPDISISTNNIKIFNISEQTRFKVPNVTNNSGVDYSWYIGNTQLMVDANGYFNYNATDDFVIYLETVGTRYYNSVKLYCNYINVGYEDQYLTIESLDDNNKIIWMYIIGDPWFTNAEPKTIEYSTDLVNWNSITSTSMLSPETACILNEGEKIYIRGNNSAYYGNAFHSTSRINVSGNIMSLIYGDDFERINTLEQDYTFSSLFFGAVKLINANHLVLPATTLAKGCYTHMFYNCVSLVNAPELPATTLANDCYDCMFIGCKSLVTAPELPATILKAFCYLDMFAECTSLVTAPELPATTLVKGCYEGMFWGCTSLVTAPELPATTLAQWCYQNMFNGCTNLTTAPELPAIKLAYECMHYMFAGCTSLTTVKILATDISAKFCLYGWLYRVSPTGTFIKKSSVEYPVGESGIPEGWTVVNI